MHTTKALLLSIVTVFLLSCSSGNTVKLLYPEEFQYVVDRNGKVEGYLPDLSGNKVISFATKGNFEYQLEESPKGKIDRIINDNPDWAFVFYIPAQLKDTSKIISLLDSFDCNFPVVIDTEDKFSRINGFSGQCGLIGFICNDKNKCLGASVIGDSKSFFDSEFIKAKRIINGKR